MIIIYDAENIGTIVIRNLNDGNDSFINVICELLADSSCGRGVRDVCKRWKVSPTTSSDQLSATFKPVIRDRYTSYPLQLYQLSSAIILVISDRYTSFGELVRYSLAGHWSLQPGAGHFKNLLIR